MLTKDMQVIREVNDQAEAFYNKAVQLGQLAVEVLGKDRHAQLTQLENIANTALKYTDIFDYIKKQMARIEDWRKEPSGYAKSKPDTQKEQQPAMGLGGRLLKELQELQQEQANIAKRLHIEGTSDKERRQKQQIYLQLIRQFVRQMVAEYEFRKEFPFSSQSHAK